MHCVIQNITRIEVFLKQYIDDSSQFQLRGIEYDVLNKPVTSKT